MERIPRGVYTQEFRQQAVKLVEDEGLSVAEVARRLSMPVPDAGSIHSEILRRAASRITRWTPSLPTDLTSRQEAKNG